MLSVASLVPAITMMSGANVWSPVTTSDWRMPSASAALVLYSNASKFAFGIAAPFTFRSDLNAARMPLP